MLQLHNGGGLGELSTPTTVTKTGQNTNYIALLQLYYTIVTAPVKLTPIDSYTFTVYCDLDPLSDKKSPYFGKKVRITTSY